MLPKKYYGLSGKIEKTKKQKTKKGAVYV